MKKIVLAVLLIASYSSMACDACGCSGMTVGFGDLSFYNQNSVGLRYSLRQFNAGNGISDFFLQTELNGNYALNSDWSFSLSIPYLYAQRNQPESEKSLQGLSDISLKANYFLLRLGNDELNHRIKLGAALNLPTGRFEDHGETLIPQNFQIGTGSVDFQMELEFQFGYKNWLSMTSAKYLHNSKNPSDYKFGNQARFEALVAYKIAMKKMALVPLFVLSYEHFDQDVNERSYYQFGTGGESINAQIGIQLKIKKFLFVLNGGGNIRNHTNGDYNPGYQANLSVNYIF